MVTQLVRHATKHLQETQSLALEAADRVYRDGGSPRAQIDAARETSGIKLTYTAHQSDRERARTLAKLAKKQAKEIK